MSRKEQMDSPEMDDDDMELHSPREEDDNEQEDSAPEDDDLNFKKNENEPKKKDQKPQKEIKTQPVKDKEYDEVFEVSDHGSEYASENEQQDEEDERPKDDSADEPPLKPAQKPQPQANQQKPGAQGKLQPQKQPVHEKKEESDEDEDDLKIPGAYNPADYVHLNGNSEIAELFGYITRYKPVTVELETGFKAFIPDYIPAVGEVDAFLKPSRPDAQPETLSLLSIDEPCLNQSKKSKLDLMIKEFMKIKKTGSNAVVHSIEIADKNPKEILAWINDVNEVHKKKQPPSVVYTKPFPEIETLMQEWPLEVEDAFQHIKIPTEEVDMDLAQYCKLACALLDIPVHNTTNNKNVIESLHVLFTLYSEFRANPHFQQNNDQGF